jgi:hypothetical protein
MPTDWFAMLSNYVDGTGCAVRNSLDFLILAIRKALSLAVADGGSQRTLLVLVR